MSERTRNTEVPYPQNLEGQRGEFENYLFGLVTSEAYSLSTLPDAITVGGVERYVNWLAHLTKADPLKRERASTVFMNVKDLSSCRLVFPTNPNIAKEETPNEVLPLYSFGKNFMDLVHVHSHPNSTSFSPRDFIGMVYNYGGEEPSSVAHIIATQGRNYMILRTQESIFLPIDYAKQLAAETDTDVTTGYRDSAQMLLDSSGAKTDEEYLQAFGTLMDFSRNRGVGSEYLLDMMTLIASLALSDKLGYGLYFSNKDGVYNRVTREGVTQEIYEFYSDYLTQTSNIQADTTL